MASVPEYRCFAVALMLVFCSVAAGAQQVEEPRTLTFDVVSIKPAIDGERRQLQTLPDGYYAIGRELWVTIATAYATLGTQSEQSIRNAPSWVMQEKYDFRGTVAAENRAEWADLSRAQVVFQRNDKLQGMLQPMLRAALQDRCKLAVHTVMTEADGYALVIGTKGINRKALKSFREGEEIPSTALTLPEGARMVPVRSNEDSFLTFYRTSMAAMLATITMGRPVPIIDRTGLKGRYDFKLPRLENGAEPPGIFDVGSLGLKIVPAKVPVEVVVIDHIERPTAN